MRVIYAHNLLEWWGILERRKQMLNLFEELLRQNYRCGRMLCAGAFCTCMSSHADCETVIMSPAFLC